MKRVQSILALVLMSLLIPAFAGPLDIAKAKEHLAAVSAGDLEALMKDYADDAYMDWVGGPLEGRYTGKAAIRAVWQKFIAANEGKPRAAIFGEVESYANPKGVSIETKAVYTGKTQTKVWHVLVFRDGTLTTELWQNTPALQVDE